MGKKLLNAYSSNKEIKMKISLQNITVSELVAGYENKAEEGVRGYNGRLNIRPSYQREFIEETIRKQQLSHCSPFGMSSNL